MCQACAGTQWQVPYMHEALGAQQQMFCMHETLAQRQVPHMYEALGSSLSTFKIMIIMWSATEEDPDIEL